MKNDCLINVVNGTLGMGVLVWHFWKYYTLDTVPMNMLIWCWLKQTHLNKDTPNTIEIFRPVPI